MKSTLNFVLGYTDVETVKLDLDNMRLEEVRKWANQTLNEFDLWGYLIRRSSENSYHVIFDRPVSWSENLSIVSNVYLWVGSRDLNRWLVMQCRKQTSTIRCTPKGNKPTPTNIELKGRRDNKITNFLEEEKMIKNIYDSVIKS